VYCSEKKIPTYELYKIFRKHNDAMLFMEAQEYESDDDFWGPIPMEAE
jgi:hypothetical protein